VAKFRMVHTEFWDDPKVVEEMTPEDKFFFLYLLTNSNTTQIGIYQITKKQMAFDIGYSIESINSLLERFVNHHNIVFYNAQTRELAIKNWGKYNFHRGGKPVLDCVAAELKAVKDTSLIQYVGERIAKPEIKKLYESYYDTSTIRGQEQQQEEEKEKEKEEEEEQQEHLPKMSADDFYQQNFGILNSYIGEQIEAWVGDLNEDLVIEAMKRALAQQKKWKYAEGILKNWANANVHTVSDVQSLDKEFERRKGFRVSSKPIRTEVLPGWFDEEQKHRMATPEKETEADAEAKKQELEEILSEFRSK
jgi:DnaD/phage-associated family protein